MARVHISKIFEELEHTSGRNDKIAILKRERDKNNTILKDVFRAALDPFKVYGIKKIPDYKSSGRGSNINLLKAIKMLDGFHDRVYTGNRATNQLQFILENLADDEGFVIERIIGRDMKVGVLASTVNKVWPKLIPVYPVMLCSAYDEKAIKKITYPGVVQQKCDGMRVNFIIENGKMDVRSRNGKPIDLHGHMSRQFAKMSAGNNFMYDGELLVLSEDGKSYLSRKKGNGIINKAMKGTLPVEQIKRVVVVLWDVIDLASFHAGIEDAHYSTRWKFLQSIQSKLKSDLVRLVPTQEVHNIDEAYDFYMDIIRDGGEGAILKNWASPWENKRSKHQIKMKVEDECDLKIVSLVEGEGKHAGKLGSFACSSADGLLKVNVGSGFSDAERKQYWDPSVVGKVVAVKFNEVIESEGSDIKRLFLPIFLEVREDKTEADTLAKIEAEASIKVRPKS